MKSILLGGLALAGFAGLLYAAKDTDHSSHDMF